MTLWLHVHGGYPSYGMSGEGWGPADWDGYKLVQALKGHPINGYVTLKKADGTWVRITNQNPEQALDLFGQWGAQKLREVGIQNALLVPVPASDCVALGTDQKGNALAQAIANHHAGCVPFSALCWAEPLQKASEGGLRDADALFEKILIATEIPSPGLEVVLLDDVASTGGHLVAGARALRFRERTVRFALCAAQTVNTHPGNMFDIPPRDLEVVVNFF